MAEGRRELRARERADLERECRVWCRYLAGIEPPSSVRSRYVEAHALGVLEHGEPEPRPRGGGLIAAGGPEGRANLQGASFDESLVAFARAGTLAARCADVHARVLDPAGLLRRKLVLACALLETDPASWERLDRAAGGSRGVLALRLAWASLRFALLFAAGLFVLLPLRMACALGAGSGGRE